MFQNSIINQINNTKDDKLIISFSLPYQFFIKPFNLYHEFLIHSDWRFQSNLNSNSNLNITNSIFDLNKSDSNLNNDSKNTLIFDNLKNLRLIINKLNDSYASFGIIIILNEFRLSDFKITISIIGTNLLKNEMIDIRLKILQNYSQILKSTIQLNPLKNQFCFNSNNELKLDLINFISNVSNFNKCSIYIEKNFNDFNISIIGFKDQVKVTENKINLFIDDMNPQFFSDYLELSSISILPLICGTDLFTLKRIIKETNCNIYLPNLLPELYYNNSLEIEFGNPKIFLTGLRSEVLLAKKWLSDLINKFTKTPFIKQLSLISLKREFLILNQLIDNNGDYFDNLMFHNSTYISIPSLGSKISNTSTITAKNNSNIISNSSSSLSLKTTTTPSSSSSPSNISPSTSSPPPPPQLIPETSASTSTSTSTSSSHNISNKNLSSSTSISSSISPNNEIGDLITFQGNSIEEVELAINEFVNKISTYYSEKVEFIIKNQDHLVDINKLLNFNDSIAFNSNCFITCSKIENKYTFQILGNSDNVKIATNYLSQFNSYINEILKNQFIKFQIELPINEKDFIAGKKNGKIIKIINMSSVSIKLLPFNDHNFIVEISGNDLIDSILGLGLFEDELPTIYNFNVPESFHRQIIGVGGQTIQIIMRKFNVFVKFSNSFELSDKTLDNQHNLQATNFQQSFIRKNNVIIKCPSKNKFEIPLAKIELENLVDKVKRNSYSCSIVKLSIQQWKLLTSYEFNILYNINRKKPTNFITELEKKTNTFIDYPSIDSISNNLNFINLKIFGIENNSKMCCLELKKIIPYNYEFKLNKDSNLKCLELINILKIDKINLFQSNKLSQLQLNFLNNIVVPMKLLYNLELEIKSNDQYDSIIIYYYPHAFGFTMNVINPERISEQEQTQIIYSNSFNQIIMGMKKFLSDWNINLISSDIFNDELIIEDLGYHHGNSN
ncbi:hypothetical protein C6P40_004083 [Pichia californica]|uniref:K Homology domain-containing protein n=1 Tax=Pichia californica TaxID=460514 RepID=A0A9P7BEJ9_9ASCO|nr:hypothetical protein C6P42_003778 [[Candida] californica]KAG0686448.1 hypothetical protein C6P40_004083 [[Candida] californica]